MSDTPPPDAAPVSGRDRTPELVSSREKRRREDEEDDRDNQRDRSNANRSGRRHRDDDERDRDRDRDRDRERERERRHRRHREDETEEERRERHRRRDEETEEERRDRRRRREEETEEERDERHKRRKDREVMIDHKIRRESREISLGSTNRHSHHQQRDRSRESHGSSSHRPPRDDDRPSIKEMTREEKEAEREKRDQEMAEEKREAARLREAKFAEMDRERELERRRLRDEERGPRDRSPPRRRRGSPSYSSPAPPPPRDPATALLDEVEREQRSIFVSQLSARLTSHDLGMFFEDKLGRGAVRDARIVTDKVSRRSKGIGYVELDAVELVHRALTLTGTIVLGLPINIMLTESERNRETTASSAPVVGSDGQVRPAVTFGQNFPPLSTGLAVPPGLDVDAHKDGAIPYHRLFISNLAFSLSSDDLRQVFEPFGEIEFVDLHIDFSGMKKGTAYVQFKDLRAAQMALDAMAGFELAGRPIRVQTVQDRAYVATEQIEDNGNYGTRLDANQRQQLMFKLARTEPNVNLALSAHKPIAIPSKTPQMNPTPFVIVSNMFNPEEETERNWDLDLAEDVKGEVESKYGKVNRIKVEKMSAGEVYIEFGEIDGATSAIKGLNGRFFGGRQLQASYISETLFKAHL
ncbi:uncharacterized protein IL334_005291 [Kwoniella shivajii]|uniref:RRM domain-containing protein n=1 Tax=Kwoniella shivajii TaxID=564305 RepID=A0ABZ1D4I8_9TREE|nr:hypothetical protein IL334_005291 [Kwoniella shivajii]